MIISQSSSNVSQNATGKINSLECLRGIAALIVIGWHLMLGFAPRYSGIFPNNTASFVIPGHPWSAFINGPAAVSFFFVLSGFVLPWGYFHSGNIHLIIRGVFKRWPRLAGACLIVTLTSWIFFATGCYFFKAAGDISSSAWLKDFAYSGLPQSFKPSFWGAFVQGSYKVFFLGEAFYDTSLWTMHPELLGSIVSFLSAPLLYHIRKPLLLIVMTTLLGYVMSMLNPHMPEFILGTLLARIYAEHPFTLSFKRACLIISFSLVMLGFYGPTGFFAWLGKLGITSGEKYPWIWAPASALIIICTIACVSINKFLSGRWASFLGRASFPIYLIHVPLICSIGSWAYINSVPYMDTKYATLLSSIIVLIVTFAYAIPLGMFDQWWIKKINQVTQRMTHQPEKLSIYMCKDAHD